MLNINLILRKFFFVERTNISPPFWTASVFVSSLSLTLHTMPKQQQVVRKSTASAEKKQQKAKPSLKKTIKKAPHVEKAKIEEKTKEIKKIDATQQSSTEKELFLEKRVKDLEEELAQLKKALGTSAPEKNGEKTAESPNSKRKREIKPSKKVTKKDKKSDEATPSKEGEVKNEDEKKEVEKKDAKINGKLQPPPQLFLLCVVTTSQGD